jgi:succinate dehydrogenase/fumarate reductase cytochrome b subunit
MELRTSVQICQRITTVGSFIYYKIGYMVVSYLDDLGGAETFNKACDAYDTLGGLLAKCIYFMPTVYCIRRESLT